MNRSVLLAGCLLFLTACNTEEPAIQTGVQVEQEPAQILLHNAQIYTMAEGSPTASAMLFDAEGQILDIGDNQVLLSTHKGARQIDLEGKTVIPGLIDAHAHLYGLAVSLSQAQLQDTASKEEVIRKLREHEQNLAADDWLLGRGWDQNDWPVKAFPSRQDLDTAFPDRPVWLERIDGHAGWANSAALAMADQDLSGDWQPVGGNIHRDTEGQASGVMIDGAMSLVESAVPEMSHDLLVASLDLALQRLVSLGLTGVHDMGVNQQVISLFQQRIGAGQFPTRVYAFADGAGETLDWLCDRGAINDKSGRLYMRAVKLYVDGAMGSRGAALHADYSDEPGNSGLLFMSSEELEVSIDKALSCGFQAGVHAIGDLGNKVTLDALESSMQRHPENPGRHRVEHAQTLTAMDIPRFAELDIIAAMQPTHATSDMYWVEDRLGPQRTPYAYAWRSLADSGARLALGSDFPVEKVNPMLGIHAAVTRQDLDGWPPGGWYPQEALTREEAVRGFTLDAAYSGFMEESVGSLEAGKRADFVVLDRNIFEIDARDIPATLVLQTWLDGEIVYQSP